MRAGSAMKLAWPFAALSGLVLPALGMAMATSCSDEPLADPVDASKAPPVQDAGGPPVLPAGSPLTKVNHVVVVYLENHSFDNLFGSWPGAEGLANVSIPQIDRNGNPFGSLPQYGPYPTEVESLADASVPNNGPFDLTNYFQENAFINDLLHRFYQEQAQINGGNMDSYALWNDESAGQSMGFWPTSTLPVAQWMQAHPANVTLCDHFFHAAFGGSFLNHFWLIAAQSPIFPGAPSSIVATPDAFGVLQGVADTTAVPPGAVYTASVGDGQVTPDGFVVNTSYSVNEPHPAKYDMAGASTSVLMPQQTFPTIGDRLDTAGVSWTWYAGGWNAALATAGVSSVGTAAGSDVPDTGAIPADIGAYSFQFHHQPFTYFANWGGTANNGGVGTKPPNGKWAQGHNLQDELDFVAAAAGGTLPAVSFVKPLYDEHSNYTTETESQNLGPRPPARDGQVGTGDARAGDHHLPVREGRRGQDRLRHDVDPPPHRGALGSAAAHDP